MLTGQPAASGEPSLGGHTDAYNTGTAQQRLHPQCAPITQQATPSQHSHAADHGSGWAAWRSIAQQGLHTRFT